MFPDWRSLHRLLVIDFDATEAIEQLEPALFGLRQSLPDAHITLLTIQTSLQLAPLLLWVDEVLADSVNEWSSFGTTLLNAGQAFGEQVPALVESLRSCQFEAAIVFTSKGRSPYAMAYLCYLAGMPIRCGQSLEFGGGVLSHWVKPPLDEEGDRHLHLLRSIGLATQDSALSQQATPAI